MFRTFLTAEWRSLVALNYTVDRASLQPLLPRGTELDLWKGEALVSVIGFLFLRTRVLGFPIPGHQNFEELNLRFYVRRRVGGEWRRGVVFVKEIVPRLAVATVARLIYNENYIACPMRHTVPQGGAGGVFRYEWRWRGRVESVRVETAGELQPMPAGSEMEFIFEHYWGYAVQRDGGTVEYEVAHEPWLAWETSHAALDADVAALYGPAFAESLGASPRSAFVANGSPVAVYRGVRI